MIFGGQEVESEGVMPVLQFYRGVNASTEEIETPVPKEGHGRRETKGSRIAEETTSRNSDGFVN